MHTLGEFYTELARVLATISEEQFRKAVQVAARVRDIGGCVYFIGNGGSAAIASHMAIDWMNKGGFNARALNDPAALTCLANDYGYEEVFWRQLQFMKNRDLLVAISSSGVSKNIHRAIDRSGTGSIREIFLSGFSINNYLQQCMPNGVSFHIPSSNYAIVENAHMAILHAMLEALKP